MAGNIQGVMKGQIHYYDEGKAPDAVVIGQFEYVQAQRKFTKTLAEAGQSGDLEYMSYLAYLASRRQKLIEDSVTFDAWAPTVLMFEIVPDEGEAPAPPA